MANLVSPGVSVTITDESFFIPAAAVTVPLIFIATAAEKKQPDGVTDAAGTFEHNVVRTVTSLQQSTQLYGIPRFLQDNSGNPQHGDARNEYGLFALNQFLGLGNLSYVVRANVNLNDSLDNIRDMWDLKMQEASFVLENITAAYISEYNLANGYVPSSDTSGYQQVTFSSAITGSTATNLVGGTTYTATITIDGGAPIPISVLGSTVPTFSALLTALNTQLGVSASAAIVGGNLRITSASTGNLSSVSIVNSGADPLFAAPLNSFSAIAAAVAGLSLYKITVTMAEFLALVEQATASIWTQFSFINTHDNFIDDHTSSPLPVFPNGYNNPAVPPGFLGMTGIALDWVLNQLGSTPGHTTEWNPTEAGNTLLGGADEFKYTVEFLNETSLGANDAARRTAIVTALNATINSNTDVRGETFEYNLIVCPGYFEVVTALNNLAQDIKEEALVIADTPFNLSPDDTATWASTVARVTSRDVAYYYPHGLSSNLDGNTVFVAASGTALRTYTYSDSVADLWFAPAGTRRGLVSGLSDVGYVTGQLGAATTFVSTALNQGQRDNLYKYFTNINPIVFFPGRGILVWGQKTSAPDASALDRVNVVRLMMYIKRQLRKNTMSFVFEPNDQLTRDNIKAVVDGFLGELIIKRGLFDFATVCDTSNNTPDRIDRNELHVDIALKPIKAAEFIYIPIRVLATGAQI